MAKISAPVSGQITGSGQFFVTDLLKVSGSITNPVGNLILSSSMGIVYVSGNLQSNGLPIVSGTVDLGGLDSRFVFTSSFDAFTASYYEFSASHTGSSFDVSIGDLRYVTTASFDPFSASLLDFTSSVKVFSASQLGFNDNFNSFTASFSGSVQSIGDNRYILTGTINEQVISSSLMISGAFRISGSKHSEIILGTSGSKGVRIRNQSNGGGLHIGTVAGESVYVFANGWGLSDSSIMLNRPIWNVANGMNLNPNDKIGWCSGTNYGPGQNDTTIARHSRSVVGGGFVEFSGNSGPVGLVSKSGILIFSSSVGSIVAFSASQDFVNQDKNYHIRSTTGDLILSSSSGSTIAISGNLDLKNNYINNVDTIQFRLTSSHVHQEGALHWNSDDKTLNLDTEVADTSIQVGQENVIRCTNKTGVDITNGSVVYVSGAQGNRPTIALADADVEHTTERIIGVVTSDILDNRTGYVTTFGLVRDIDTSGTPVGEVWTEGDCLYTSATPGKLTNVRPLTPAHAVKVATVINASATVGILLVNVHTGFELDELHDVSITGSQADDILKFDGTLWRNVPMSTGLSSSFVLTSSLVTQRISSSIALTGTLVFPEDAASKSAHVIAPNSHLVLSSSLGYVYVSGSLGTRLSLNAGSGVNAGSFLQNGSDRYTLRSSTSRVVLTSSQSAMALSGNAFYITDDAAPGTGQIIAPNSHLILSSSAGSIVFLSSSLSASGQIHCVSPDVFPLRATRTSTTITNEIRSAASVRMRTTQNMADGFGPSISFETRDSSNEDFLVGRIACIKDGLDNSGKLIFSTYNSGVVKDYIYLDHTGSMGLNNASPSARLHVSGNIKVTEEISNPVGHLILSSSAGSQVTISGNLAVSTGQVGFSSVYTNTPTGTTQTIDWNNGNTQILDLGSTTGNVTLDFINKSSGATYALKIIQHGTSARTITWSGVTWVGAEMSISSVLSSVTFVSFYCDGSLFFGSGEIEHNGLYGLDGGDGLGTAGHYYHLSELEFLSGSRFVMTSSLVTQRISSSLAITGTLIVSGSDASEIILGASGSAGALRLYSRPVSPSQFYALAGNGNTVLSMGVSQLGITTTIGFQRPVWDAGGINLDPTNGIKWSPVAGQAQTFNDTVLLRDAKYPIGGMIAVSGSSGSAGFSSITGHLVLSSSAGSQVTVSSSLNVAGQAGFTQVATSTPTTSTFNLDCNLGNSQILDLGSVTASTLDVMVVNMKKGSSYTISVKQHPTSAKTINWLNVSWVGDIAPSVSTDLSSYTIFAFFYDGTELYGNGEIGYNAIYGTYREEVSGYTVTQNDYVIAIRTTSGSIGVQLPTAIGSTGKQIHVKKTSNDANSVVLSASAGQTIDGETTQSFNTQWTSMNVVSNGVDGWYII